MHHHQHVWPCLGFSVHAACPEAHIQGLVGSVCPALASGFWVSIYPSIIHMAVRIYGYVSLSKSLWDLHYGSDSNECTRFILNENNGEV